MSSKGGALCSPRAMMARRRRRSEEN